MTLKLIKIYLFIDKIKNKDELTMRKEIINKIIRLIINIK
jgi:hypothetical protein